MNTANSNENPRNNRKLMIRHAGSLKTAFNAINREFQRLHPDVRLVTEAGGSAHLIRQVINGEECGVLASADYNLIRQWMIPEHAGWGVIFASNEIAIRCTEKSPYHNQINAGNWFEILLKEGVTFWVPDTNDDPGGYRTLMILQLAEKYYRVRGLYDRFMASPNIRSYVSATNDQMDAGYTIAYTSSPCPGSSWNIHLPDEINLSKDQFRHYYQQAIVKISGPRPEAVLILRGEPIKFGVTIPDNTPFPDLAVEWLCYLLSDEGAAVAGRAGLAIMRPPVAMNRNHVPSPLLKYVI